MKVLSVSHSILLINSPHAGGQTYAYYMSQIAKNPNMELRVICMCDPMSANKEQFDAFHAKGTLLYTKGGVLRNVRRVLWDLYGRLTKKTALNSYYKYREYIKALKRQKREGYKPDIIILEWTQCVSLASECRKLYPNARLIASEHDVTFLSYERQAEALQHESSRYKHALTMAKRVKDEELKAICLCDKVMPHNEKDKQLLINNGIKENNIHTITAYYHNLNYIKRKEINHDILFWGAMSRPENYNAALWFINNVMPRLADTDVRFVVVGNKPNPVLLKCISDRVVITGFVENPDPYFERSLCLVAPLSIGAGIKVKILEALSSGIPVLTNQIGIEGIPAENGKSYFHCTTPEDYEIVIRKLLYGEIDTDSITKEATEVILNCFDLNQSAKDYINMLEGLVGLNGRH